MVLCRNDSSWKRRGISFLWDMDLLCSFASPSEVLTMREFHEMEKSFPDELPSNNGDAVIVSGLEGCVDVLSAEDAEYWLSNHLKRLMLSFQSEFEGQSALIFWLPAGRNRIKMSPATEEYTMSIGSDSTKSLEIGRLLWAGAAQGIERILNTDDSGVDPDGTAYAGLHNTRIS